MASFENDLFSRDKMDQLNKLYRLGYEELVMAVGLAGDPETAGELLTNSLGISNGDEKRGRLLSANHSLVSKGYIILENERACLQEDFKRLIDVIIKNNFSLRLNYGLNHLGYSLAFYYLNDRIIKQEILPGFVYQFSCENDSLQTVQEGYNFLKIGDCSDFSCPCTEIQQSILEEAKKKAAIQPDTVLEYLKYNGIHNETAKLLNDDLIHSDFRGSVMRVEKRDGKIISDRGFLVMVCNPRAWLFPIFLKDNVPFARIVPGTKASFKKETLALLD